MNAFESLYNVVCDRREHPAEGSYTCYLFDKGLDKILKKVGEESAEVIIASKGDSQEDIKNEMCDLYYHLTVLMVERGIALSEIEDILFERSKKIGNLKQMRKTDKNT